MIRNKIGQQRLQRQRRWHVVQRILAILCLGLMVAIIAGLSGWWKLSAVVWLPLAILIEFRGNKAYDRVLYEEREKEQIANALRRRLPEYHIVINHPLEEEWTDLLVVGPTGLFVIHITQLRYNAVDEDVDRRAMELQATAQRLCPNYPVEALIYARRMAMLSPLTTRITATHTPNGLADCIIRSRECCTNEEIEQICAILKIVA